MTTFPNVSVENTNEEIQNEEIQNEDISPEEVFVEKPVKQKRKPRKPLSDEAKEKLKIAREKSLEVRRQKKKDRENANKKVVEESKPIDIPKKVEHKKVVEIIDEEHNEVPNGEVSSHESSEEEEKVVYVKKNKKQQKKKPKIVYVEESSDEEEPKIVYKKKQKKQNKPKDLFTAQEVEIYANHKVNTYKKQIDDEKQKSKKKLEEARRNLLWNMR
jgi:hypothetical protein